MFFLYGERRLGALLSLKALRELVTGLVERADRADIRIEKLEAEIKSCATKMTRSGSRTPA
ncbi:MAG: hypothetical protein DI589_20065 [Shinella sp.]|nr:MAG: hypothetical protein DI589_20065 [Shinella sp.]